VVVLEEPSEPFPALDRAVTFSALAWHRKEYDIALALVWALCMIVGHVLVERMQEEWFPNQDQPRQGFILGSVLPVMLALRRSSRQVVVADDELDSTDRVGKLLRK
jgi:hypothetical protein